jgi:hypothetical protein
VISHESQEVEFTMEVTERFPGAAVRQIDEGVRVITSRAKIVMNSKTQWHQPPIVRVVTDTGNVREDQPGAAEAGLIVGRQRRGGGRGRGRGVGRGGT